jgi:hypothetical protein
MHPESSQVAKNSSWYPVGSTGRHIQLAGTSFHSRDFAGVSDDVYRWEDNSIAAAGIWHMSR